jgi:hypothetical protein
MKCALCRDIFRTSPASRFDPTFLPVTVNIAVKALERALHVMKKRPHIICKAA